MRRRLSLLTLVAVTMSACSTDGTTPVARPATPGPSPAAGQPTAGASSPAAAPSASPAPGSTASASPTAAAPPPQDLRVVLDLGDGTQVTGELDDSPTARSLLEQLPLTLGFTDFGGQEKIAALPAPLSTEGAPARSDAPAQTIGYWTPSRSLVLYYESVGGYAGIVPIGRMDDVGPLVARTDDFTATVSALG